jgi:hypothetical protein
MPLTSTVFLLVTLMLMWDGANVINFDVQLHAVRMFTDYSVSELKLPSLNACGD